MKKQMILVGVVLLAALQLATGTEFLTNGNMSEGGEKPDKWALANYKSGEPVLSRDTATFKSEPAALLLSLPAEKSFAFAQQRLGGDAGIVQGDLKVSGYVKVEGAITDAQIIMQVFNGAGKQTGWKVIASFKPGDDWQKIDGTASFPEGQIVLFGLLAKGQGKVWLDDASVTGSGDAAPGAEPAAASAPAGATGLPVSIDANNSALHYSGRFVAEKDGSMACAWPASSVTIHFKGTDLNAKLEFGDKNRVQVWLDGAPGKILSGKSADNLFSVVSGLPAGEHTVQLVKCTEASFGVMRFYGVQLNNGAEVLPVTPPQHHIEVIGDSISAGFGNEASSQNEKFSPTTENACLAYGALTARKFGADYTCTAWSGKTMWPKNTLPELYDRTLPQQQGSTWDFKSQIPDVVLVNLCTNDFSGGIPEEGAWVKAYVEFLQRVRANYPNADIYCALGPMLFDRSSKKELSTAREYLQKIVKTRQDAGDSKVRFLEFTTQDGKMGFGAQWHPSLKTHARMADEFAAALEKDLNWQPVNK